MLRSSLAAAFSTSLACTTTKARLLSLWALLLTYLSWILYTSFTCRISCRAHSRFPLAFLLSSIFLHVSGVIHCLFFFFLKSRTLSVVSWHTFTIMVTPGCFNNVLIFSIFNFKCTEAISRLNSELPFNLRGTELDVKYFVVLLGGSGRRNIWFAKDFDISLT